MVCLVVVSLVMVDASVSVTEWCDVVELVKVRKLVSNSVDSSEEVIALVVKVACLARARGGEIAWPEHLKMTMKQKKMTVFESILRAGYNILRWAFKEKEESCWIQYPLIRAV